MTSTRSPSPPPLPQTRAALDRRRKLIISSTVPIGLVIALLVVLRATDLMRLFSIPTGAMAPTVSAGDHVVMEGLTYCVRNPRRGDITVFKTDGIPSVPPAQIYFKRLVGEPGERVRISGGKVYINDAAVSLSNDAGEIVYTLPPSAERMATETDVIVPPGQYYMLGDNSTNSYDSRFWGFVPASNVLGRVVFRFWPPQRIGGVR